MGSHGLRYSFLAMENAQPLNPSLPKRLSAFLSSVERRDTLEDARVRGSVAAYRFTHCASLHVKHNRRSHEHPFFTGDTPPMAIEP